MEASQSGYEVRGSIVRAYVREVEKLGILEDVAARVTAETRTLMRDLPLQTVWLVGYRLDPDGG